MAKDVRFALRALRKNPVFTIVAVATLALGIGANTTVFSAVYAVTLARPPFPSPEDLRVVRAVLRGEGGATDTLGWWSYPMYEAFRDGASGIGELAAYTPRALAYNLAGSDAPQQARVEMVSASYFGLLGVQPMLGRGFAPDEDLTPGTHSVAVLSHGLWQAAFGADSSVIGRTITLNSVPVAVIGIMGPGFAGLSGQADMWVPVMMAPTLVFPRRLEQKISFWHAVVARVEPGATDERLAVHLASGARSVEAEIPLEEAFGPMEEPGFAAVPLAAARVDPAVRRALLVLLGAVLCVLLIACVNVANLLLARGAARTREIGVRVALGVGRARLARQLLVESLVLAAMGGAAAVVLAAWGLGVLTALRPPALAGTVDLAAARLSGPVLIFNFGVALCAGLAFGLAPAWASLRADARTLLTGRRDASGRIGPRGGLVAIQIALAVVLLVGASLLVRSLMSLQQTPLGFTPDGVLTAYVNVPRQAYSGQEASRLFTETVSRLRELPGVRRAAVANCLPVSGGCDNVQLEIEGEVGGAEQRGRYVSMNMVDSPYFAAMGIPLVAGRAFTALDDSTAPRVAILNEAAARHYWPGRDPIGERIQLSVGWGAEDDWAEVVGVVGDVKRGALHAPAGPTVYLSYIQYSYRSNYLVVQTDGDPGAIAGSVRRVIGQVDPGLPLWDVRTMRERVATATAADRFSTALLSVFGVMALALAAVGVYGVISFSVARRTREIGVRVAMGAREADVLRMVLRQGLGVTLVGVAVGGAIALLAARLLRGQLRGISAADPLAFAAAVVLLVGVGAFASLLPARRAARIDPMEALRQE